MAGRSRRDGDRSKVWRATMLESGRSGHAFKLTSDTASSEHQKGAIHSEFSHELYYGQAPDAGSSTSVYPGTTRPPASRIHLDSTFGTILVKTILFIFSS